MKKLVLPLFLFLLSVPAQAQDTLSVTVPPALELIDGKTAGEIIGNYSLRAEEKIIVYNGYPESENVAFLTAGFHVGIPDAVLRYQGEIYLMIPYGETARFVKADDIAFALVAREEIPEVSFNE